MKAPFSLQTPRAPVGKRYFSRRIWKSSLTGAVVLACLCLGVSPTRAQVPRAAAAPTAASEVTVSGSCSGYCTLRLTPSLFLPSPARRLAQAGLFSENANPELPAAALPSNPRTPVRAEIPGGVHWKPLLLQSAAVLGAFHVSRLVAQPFSRRALRGPYFKDYFRSVHSIWRWNDGGRFIENYVYHAWEGSVFGFVFVQNDPRGMYADDFGSRAYWVSRLKAMGWSGLMSLDFEIGPFVSESALGNVRQGWVDIVMTPTLGLGWMVGEDAADKYFIRKIERWDSNPCRQALARVAFNPTRTVANAMRWRAPWHRDTRDLWVRPQIWQCFGIAVPREVASNSAPARP